MNTKSQGKFAAMARTVIRKQHVSAGLVGITINIKHLNHRENRDNCSQIVASTEHSLLDPRWLDCRNKNDQIKYSLNYIDIVSRIDRQLVNFQHKEFAESFLMCATVRTTSRYQIKDGTNSISLK